MVFYSAKKLAYVLGVPGIILGGRDQERMDGEMGLWYQLTKTGVIRDLVLPASPLHR